MGGARSKRARCAATTTAALLVHIAAGQTPGGGAVQPSQPTASQAATVPYINRALGFEVHTPAGWSYDRSGFFGPSSSFGLLRGTAPDGRASLQILLFRDARAASFSDWIDVFSRDLGSFSGVERVAVQPVEEGGRPAAYLVVDAKAGLERTRSLYYCTRLDVGTVWVYLLAAAVPGGSEAPAPAGSQPTVELPDEFRRLVATLRVYYDEQQGAELRAALDRGRDYLSRYRLQEDARRLRLDEQVRYYQVELSGQPIGYLTRQLVRERHALDEARQAQRGKEGVRVREQSWRFLPDGSAQHVRVELFSSLDGGTDLFEIWNTTIPPPGSAARPLATRDQVVREADTLFSSLRSSDPGRDTEPRSPIRLDATYLGLGWVRVLPALLGSQADPAFAFTIYDPETRGLISHWFHALGEQPLPDAPGKTAKAYQVREGYVPAAAKLFTDADGAMLRFESGELLIRPSDQASVERTFGAQRAAAESRLKP